jgi:hypothetical protein
VKVPSDYLTNVSRLSSFIIDLKVVPDVMSYNYHVLFMQIIIIEFWNILSINVEISADFDNKISGLRSNAHRTLGLAKMPTKPLSQPL